MAKIVEIRPKYKDPAILHNNIHSQHYGCWWPGDPRSQGISSHDLDLVFVEYSGLNPWRVNPLYAGIVPSTMLSDSSCYVNSLTNLPVN